MTETAWRLIARELEAAEIPHVGGEDAVLCGIWSCQTRYHDDGAFGKVAWRCTAAIPKLTVPHG